MFHHPGHPQQPQHMFRPPFGHVNTIVNTTRISDLTPGPIRDDKWAREELTKYESWTIKPAPMDASKVFEGKERAPRWLRVELSEGGLAEDAIINRVKTLNEETSVTERRAALYPNQSSQVDAFLRDKNIEDHMRDGFDWTLAQLERKERAIKAGKFKRETVSMTLYLKRAPKPQVDALRLYQLMHMPPPMPAPMPPPIHAGGAGVRPEGHAATSATVATTDLPDLQPKSIHAAAIKSRNHHGGKNDIISIEEPMPKNKKKRNQPRSRSNSFSSESSHSSYSSSGSTGSAYSDELSPNSSQCGSIHSGHRGRAHEKHPRKPSIHHPHTSHPIIAAVPDAPQSQRKSSVERRSETNASDIFTAGVIAGQRLADHIPMPVSAVGSSIQEPSFGREDPIARRQRQIMASREEQSLRRASLIEDEYARFELEREIRELLKEEELIREEEDIAQRLAERDRGSRGRNPFLPSERGYGPSGRRSSYGLEIPLEPAPYSYRRATLGDRLGMRRF